MTNDLELLREIARNSDTLTFDVANDTGQSGIILIGIIFILVMRNMKGLE